jgi:hypothetical protein
MQHSVERRRRHQILGFAENAFGVREAKTDGALS